MIGEVRQNLQREVAFTGRLIILFKGIVHPKMFSSKIVVPNL